MKNINVVAAVIKKGDLIFITQRGYGEFKDFWEFPGGKVEYDYPTFHLNMDVFLASLTDDKLVLLEHESASWVHKDELDKYNFLPADIEVIELLKKIL